MKTIFFVTAFLLSTVAANAQWVAIAANDGLVASAFGSSSIAVKQSVLKKCPKCAWAVSKTSSHLAIVRCPYNKEGNTYGWGAYSKASVKKAKQKALGKYKRAADRFGYIVRESLCTVPIQYTDGKVVKE